MIKDFSQDEEGCIGMTLDISLENLERLRNGETLRTGFKIPEDNIKVMINVKSCKTDAEIPKEVFGGEIPEVLK